MIRKIFLVIALLVFAGLGAAHANDDETDRITVKLTDASEPAYVELSLVNGGIRVTGYDGLGIALTERYPRDSGIVELLREHAAEQ